MSGGHQIDTLAVAQRVLATPDAIYNLSPIEAVALAGFRIQDETGKPPALVAPPPPLWTAMSASLAASIAVVLKSHEAATSGSAPTSVAGINARLAFLDALQTLKTRFEKEFPHVGS